MKSLNEKIKTIVDSIKTEITIHGISKISNARNNWIKIIWIICLLTASVYCFMANIEFFLQYIDFQVTTSVQYHSEDSVALPGIGICQSNPFVTNFSIYYLRKKIMNYLSINETYNTTDLEFVNHHLLSNRSLKKILLFSMNNEDYEIKSRLGLSLNETLIKCEFQGEQCAVDDFRWYFDKR